MADAAQVAFKRLVDAATAAGIFCYRCDDKLAAVVAKALPPQVLVVVTEALDPDPRPNQGPPQTQARAPQREERRISNPLPEPKYANGPPQADAGEATGASRIARHLHPAEAAAMALSRSGYAVEPDGKGWLVFQNNRPVFRADSVDALGEFARKVYRPEAPVRRPDGVTLDHLSAEF